MLRDVSAAVNDAPAHQCLNQRLGGAGTSSGNVKMLVTQLARAIEPDHHGAPPPSRHHGHCADLVVIKVSRPHPAQDPALDEQPPKALHSRVDACR